MKASLTEDTSLEIALESIKDLKQQDLFEALTKSPEKFVADQFDQRVAQRDPRTKSILNTIFADSSDDYIKDEPWYDLLQFVSVVGSPSNENPSHRALKRLAFAFVLDAADVLTGPINASADAIQHSRDRVWLHDDTTTMFTFRWCCEILGADYRHLRRTIRHAMDTGQRICTNRKLAHTYRRKNADAVAGVVDSDYIDALDVAETLDEEIA